MKIIIVGPPIGPEVLDTLSRTLGPACRIIQISDPGNFFYRIDVEVSRDLQAVIYTNMDEDTRLCAELVFKTPLAGIKGLYALQIFYTNASNENRYTAPNGVQIVVNSYDKGENLAEFIRGNLRGMGSV